MLVKDQKVMVRWNPNNKNYYVSKGYQYSKLNEEFQADIKDVPTTSHYEVEFECDYCGEHFMRSFIHTHNRNKHYCSDECKEKDSNPNGLTNSERLDYSINCLKFLQEKLGKTPTTSQYDVFAKEKGAFSRRVLQSKLNKNWNQLCENLFGKVNITKKSKNAMLDELIQLKNKLGRTPLTDELIPNGLSDIKTYMRKFDMSYNELVKSLGWETNGNFTAEIPIEDLYEKYNNLYIQLGRIPLWEDIDNIKEYPCSSTFRTKCGSISDICKHLNIPIFIDNLHTVGYGLSLIDDNGDFCRSHPEMIITNLLLQNKLIYIKEYRYSDLIINDNSRKRFDWYLPEQNIAIEYFGLYLENPHNEILMKYHDKTIEKINICKENNVKLIELYRNDLDDGYEGLINKFKEFNINIIIQ